MCYRPYRPYRPAVSRSVARETRGSTDLTDLSRAYVGACVFGPRFVAVSSRPSTLSRSVEVGRSVEQQRGSGFASTDLRGEVGKVGSVPGASLSRPRASRRVLAAILRPPLPLDGASPVPTRSRALLGILARPTGVLA